MALSGQGHFLNTPHDSDGQTQSSFRQCMVVEARETYTQTRHMGLAYSHGALGWLNRGLSGAACFQSHGVFWDTLISCIIIRYN